MFAFSDIKTKMFFFFFFYGKNPKNMDTRKNAVVILKF